MVSNVQVPGSWAAGPTTTVDSEPLAVRDGPGSGRVLSYLDTGRVTRRHGSVDQIHDLPKGSRNFAVTALDNVGNTSTTNVAFTT